MPPKNKQKFDGSNSQTHSIDIVPIEQQLSRESHGNSVPQILRKMQIVYKENKESLSISLLHMVLRLCGLSEIIPKLSNSYSDESIKAYLEQIAGKKMNSTSSSTLIISNKDKFYQQFITRITVFFSKIISDDFCYMKEQRQTKFLQRIRNLITILSRSKLRNIRYSSIQVMRLLIQCQISQYQLLINQKQSKKALQFCKDIQIYLKTIIKDRLKDIDIKIRQSLQNLIKNIFLKMESDVTDQHLINQIFLPLLQESNPKVVDAALQSLLTFLSNSKKIKTFVIEFMTKHLSLIQNIAVIPNKNGSLALKLLIEGYKISPQRNFLDPSLISRIFQFYSIDSFSYGLNIAIEAFYVSIFIDVDKIYENKTLMVIQFVNLLNNFDSIAIKQSIITHLFHFLPIPCEKICSFEDLINILMSGEFNLENTQVQIMQKEFSGWFQVTIMYAKYVKECIMKYQSFENQKYDQELTKWKTIAESFNSILLVNIRQIYHKIADDRNDFMTRYYLKLIGQLFIPIEKSFQKFIEYLIEKMIALFEVQEEITILKEIVDIFFNLKISHFSVLTSHFNQQHRMKTETIIMKKLAILSKFNYAQCINEEFAEQILVCFKRSDNNLIKTQCIIGLFVVHQWKLNNILEGSLQEYKMRQYQTIQKLVLRFLFDLISSSSQSQEITFASFNILCQIMTIVCNDSLLDIGSIYFQVKEEEIISIYRFLDKNSYLPKNQQSFEMKDDQSEDMAQYLSNFKSFGLNKEKSLKILFELFQSSSKISMYQTSLSIIMESLLQEENTLDPNQTISKLNKNNQSFNKGNNINLLMRQKLASKYFDKLAGFEILIENSSRFVYWKMFSLMMTIKLNEGKKDKIVNKLIDIYLKKKFNKEEQKISLNKALLFVVSQFDRIYDTASYHDLKFMQILLKKLVKKITKDALRRVYMFFKSKYEKVLSQSDDVQNMASFMEKTCKEEQGNNRDDEENEEQSENEEKQNKNKPNQKTMMDIEEKERNPNARNTRSMSKGMRGLKV